MNDPVETERKIAEDYRRYLQEIDARHSGFVSITKSEFLAWADANYDELIKLAINSGSSPEDAPANVAKYLEDVRGAPELSKHDDVNVNMIMRRVLSEIEDACRTFDIPTRGGVVFGASPVLGQEPRLSPVSLAEGFSIINVSISFIPFCDLIATLLAQTLVCDPSRQIISDDPDEVKARLATNPELVQRWLRTLAFCATHDWHPPKEDISLTEMESYTRIRLLRAIELFALGHEYGHHVLEHGIHGSTEGISDSISAEHDADFIAQGVSKIIGLKEEPPNDYAIAGVGAVVILGALQLVHRAKRMLEANDDTLPTSTSHPTFADRIAHIGTVLANEPADYQAIFSERRDHFVEILEIVWANIKPKLTQLHDAGIRPRPLSPQNGRPPLSQSLTSSL